MINDNDTMITGEFSPLHCSPIGERGIRHPDLVGKGGPLFDSK